MSSSSSSLNFGGDVYEAPAAPAAPPTPPTNWVLIAGIALAGIVVLVAAFFWKGKR